MLGWFTDLGPQLARIEQKLDRLLRQGAMEMADLSKLQSDVEAQTTVVASVQTLLSSLSAAIADLKSQVTDPTAQAAIDALASQVEANSKALSDAVTANTPSA